MNNRNSGEIEVFFFECPAELCKFEVLWLTVVVLSKAISNLCFYSYLTWKFRRGPKMKWCRLMHDAGRHRHKTNSRVNCSGGCGAIRYGDRFSISLYLNFYVLTSACQLYDGSKLVRGLPRRSPTSTSIKLSRRSSRKPIRNPHSSVSPQVTAETGADLTFVNILKKISSHAIV